MRPTTFAAIVGGFIGITGVMGMISPLRKKVILKNSNLKVTAETGDILGVLPTNRVFNLTRLGIGLAGLICSRNEKAAVIYNRSVAVNYAGMAVMGAIPKTNTMFGLMPIFGANILLHGVTALAELLVEPAVTDKMRGAYGVVGDKARSLYGSVTGSQQSSAMI